uniref:Uncharacterized protein n=1 Tax=Salmo trutta TaxID=8032 RepID=A0A673XPH0_SALTR
MFVKYVIVLRGVGPLPVSVRHLTVPNCCTFVLSRRYEVNTNELINEELGIAYPIFGSQYARLIKKEPETPVKPAQQA